METRLHFSQPEIEAVASGGERGTVAANLE